MTMMKKIALALTPVILMGSVVSANAATTTDVAVKPATEANLTIGVLDLAEVLQSSPQAKTAGDKLKKEFKPRQDAIVEAQQQLQKDQDKFKRDASVMNQRDTLALQEKITREQRDLQQKQENYMQDLRTAQSNEMQKVLAQIDKIVQKIAADGHYDLILQKNSVAFNSSRVDITKPVIAQLKK